MIRDRGNIKWNAMMLPEHVKMLREWHAQDNYVQKPELDEWALQELSDQLQIAYENKLEVELSVWEEKHLFKATGVIAKINGYNSTLYFEDGRKFNLYTIYGVAFTI